jgi:RNA polymerase-binding transcription factor DksA
MVRHEAKNRLRKGEVKMTGGTSSKGPLLMQLLAKRSEQAAETLKRTLLGLREKAQPGEWEGGEEEIKLATVQVEEQNIREIREAERLLEEGRLGLCVDCGRTIPESRRHILPFATRCKSCQERRETLAVAHAKSWSAQHLWAELTKEEGESDRADAVALQESGRKSSYMPDGI